ncbi:ubiquinone/menaquinone biosynthesis C-methylase UbiE [Mycobacterium sp. BK086]|uniref:class I SAM-dependent DNA methyltransferase n=1 Tax=Mycobacterium sp. BK086 TaxID=2512165 RepID=UPI0010EF8424|nr:class I SAM-dependent methyltransferase [Mycobacterium sp. BK086]TDO12189.1 ubiquinone/menaquinone biosynthesis C-methylase UbiE [Mycobacterium sp. BK086]
MSTRWQKSSAPRGNEYDARWKSLADSGHNIHGEADLVDSILRESGGHSVLDAGCGTGRVAIELANRGYSVVGVDADAGMLAAARDKAPQLRWIEADLADLSRAGVDRVNLVLLAGNVMIFLEPGTESAVLAGLAGRLTPGGLLVAGFSVRPDRLSLQQYDQAAEEAGLVPVVRWATWDREPFEGGDYAVSVHRLRRSPR